MSSILGKNSQGYGYKYTDLSAINAMLESIGEKYYQFTETDDNGNDYIYTVKIGADGKESKPIRGARIVNATLSGKHNPAQEQGSALTYARRYSLLMAYGLATTDDDAASLDGATEVAHNAEQPRQHGRTNRDRLVAFCQKRSVDMKDVSERFAIDRHTTEERFGEVLNILMDEAQKAAENA